MRAPARILGFLVACVAAFSGCGDDGSPRPLPQSKELQSFGFLTANNPSLSANVSATISGNSISATVPFGTALTALVATFTTTGARVTVGGAAQVSGVTANNFTSNVTYRVTAEDSTTRDYTVTVRAAQSSAKQLTSFAFLSASNAQLDNDVTATINGTAIAATVPFGTDVTALVATFSTTGAGVAVGGTTQVSGTTANNFTSPVIYRVTAADATTQDYTVTVTVARSSAKAITAFTFLSANNPDLDADVEATINGTAIAATVPFDTSVAALVATFSHTGQTVTVAGVEQVSGTTQNDFSSPVIYRVTAADASTQDFTVTVTRAPSPAKEITRYRFLAASNPGVLDVDVEATINGTAIAATVPAGTSVTGLIATFETTGQTVSVGGVAQTSGTTQNDFSSPVVYRVTAADASFKDFTVTVTVAPSTAKDITSYKFLSAKNPGVLDVDVDGAINGTAIAATVPFGTNVSGLIATFETTGQTVTVAGVEQISGITPNNFASPVVYRVTAADTSTKDFTVTVTVAANPAKDITSYKFLSAKNPGVLDVDVEATINGAAIAATVPFGTNVSGLIATFETTGQTVTVAGVEQISGITPNNFASPVVYRVTAADTSIKDFTVTVTVAPNPAKDITSYEFLSAKNPGVLDVDVEATINGAAIAATVPFGTNLTGLIATFETTGQTVTVAGTPQISGVTPNNFASPVIYRVTAADASFKDFTVTVTVAPNPAKDITEFKFLAAANPDVLDADVLATINGTTIAATVPFGTNVSALVATFSTTGQTVTVAGVEQISGITPNDFALPVVYRVTAADASFKDFTVTVTLASGTAKEITEFKFLAASNPGVLNVDVLATINGTSIAATVPFGTDVSGLVATFATTGQHVAVGGVVQTSGVTPNDFAGPVAYTVTAGDTSTQVFTVTVAIAPSPAKEITAFAFLAAINPGVLDVDVLATINGTAIAATVPFGTNVSGLIATFATTGATVTVNGALQTSGITANDFSAPVIYRVTAADTSTKDFTVTVTVAPSPAKEITAFSFRAVNNPGVLDVDVIATINGTAIAATVPFGTNVTALVATFATTGASVTVNGAVQASGITPNNFSSPVIYHVTAADNSTKDFTVAVTVAPSPAKEITAFSFLSANNPGLPANVIATIDGTAIAATVPFGTSVTALVATFATTGATVTVNGTEQASGITPNDFSAPVIYRVTAADTSTKDFTVTVTVALNPAKDITAFSFLSANNPGLPADRTATITGTAITATVPFGTNVTALVATFATTGQSVTVAGTPQVSGVTPNDFSAPVVYRVTAADTSTQDFTVTVAAAPAPAITAFSFQTNPNPTVVITSLGTITGTSIAVAVPRGADVTALKATFTATTSATVTVNGVTQVSSTTANDFTNPVTYRVRGNDGGVQDFTVTVTFLVTSFSFNGANGNEATFPSDGTNPALASPPVMGRQGGNGTNAGGTFSGNGWPSPVSAPINLGRYNHFTVTPGTGVTMTLTSLALRDQRSDTGPVNFAVRSSLDNFAADLATLTTHTNISNAAARSEIVLGAAFQNLTVAVEFRIYAFGSMGAGGTWRIDEVQLAGVTTP